MTATVIWRLWDLEYEATALSDQSPWSHVMDHVTVQRTCQVRGDWPNPFVVYSALYYSVTVIDCAHSSDLLLTQESWTNKVSQDFSKWVSEEWLSVPILLPPLGNLVIYHFGRLVPINQTSISCLIILFVQRIHHALDNLDAWGWSVPIVAMNNFFNIQSVKQNHLQ